MGDKVFVTEKILQLKQPTTVQLSSKCFDSGKSAKSDKTIKRKRKDAVKTINASEEDKD